ncbi:hypothetical protein [Beutenbergia cavernae]|uniref:hypothetical protein n=1 Tax=Beutenbergia cavernae TaxID=84757 RepID=UPI0002DFDE48|nr:hypothetical protein [Beutenbergia cavernae]
MHGDDEGGEAAQAVERVQARRRPAPRRSVAILLRSFLAVGVLAPRRSVAILLRSFLAVGVLAPRRSVAILLRSFLAVGVLAPRGPRFSHRG